MTTATKPPTSDGGVHHAAPSPASSESTETILLAADSASSASSADGETFSLDETMRDYPVLFNRTYHKYKEGSYVFPNDAQERDRMEQQFWLIKAAQGGRLFLAPVKNPRAVLDVGTGTGVWAISLADHVFPTAQITGIDLSPIQPREVPVNVVFEQQDCSEPDWCRPVGSFDFIYAQSLFGSLKDYAQYLITARKYLTPGTGWIECCEVDPMPYSDDGTIPADWSLTKWHKWMIYAMQEIGRPFDIAPKIKQWLVEAGYVDVQEVVVKIPIGGWPANSQLKKLGKHFQALVADSLAAASYKTFSEGLGWDREEIEIFLADTRKSMETKKVHSYYRCHTVYGRRPAPEEETKMGRMAPPPRPVTKK